jgi:hypothetical protein
MGIACLFILAFAMAISPIYFPRVRDVQCTATKVDASSSGVTILLSCGEVAAVSSNVELAIALTAQPENKSHVRCSLGWFGGAECKMGS